MLTNFNQIVLQNAVLNKYFVSFDLPVYQLAAGAQPLVSHSLRSTKPFPFPDSEPAYPGPYPGT